MKKITIVGAPGAGKSSLARVLHDVTNLPLIHLDAIFWKPRWIETSKCVWVAVQQNLVRGEEWIIEGSYLSTVDIRLQAADIVIFLDMPRRIYLWRIIMRYFFSQRKPLPDLAKGCVRKITLGFLWEIWNFPSNGREVLINKLSNISDTKQVVRLTSQKEASRFVEELRTLYKRD